MTSGVLGAPEPRPGPKLSRRDLKGDSWAWVRALREAEAGSGLSPEELGHTRQQPPDVAPPRSCQNGRLPQPTWAPGGALHGVTQDSTLLSIFSRVNLLLQNRADGLILLCPVRLAPMTSFSISEPHSRSGETAVTGAVQTQPLDGHSRSWRKL